MNDNTLLYILEDEEDRENPYGAQYVLAITKGGAMPSNTNGYAVRLFYTKTSELESLSTFEENQVVWSADNMENTQHPNRTKYYLGFAYMLCDRSPGFDIEPLPELELTAEELIALGVEGELPPEMIEIALPNVAEKSASDEAREAAEQQLIDEVWGEEGEVSEDELFNEPSTSVEVPEEDDTEVIVESPIEYEGEYDDLETDYEELFE